MAAALVPPTKSAHPTYEKCPSNLRKMCPSDLLSSPSDSLK